MFVTQVTLENYYSNLIAQHIERKQRLAKLEESLKDEGLSEQQKQEKRLQHAQKETEFLRLKRSRLGVEDFEPLKVIGRGAFGEVRFFVVIRLLILFKINLIKNSLHLFLW